MYNFDCKEKMLIILFDCKDKSRYLPRSEINLVKQCTMTQKEFIIIKP